MRKQLGKLPKSNKLNARRVTVVLPTGAKRTFASQREADRACELCLLERRGIIQDLKMQVPFELVPHQVRPDGTKEQPCKYIADFTYFKDGHYVVEDAKGYRDPKSPIYQLFTVKRKLMLQVHGIAVQEV